MDSDFILFQGRTENTDGRLPQEVSTYDLLDSLQIDYERTDHPAAFTMEECARINDVLAPAVVCKNLFLCNRKKTKFYLLMIRHDKKFNTREISQQLGVSRLSFGPEEVMLQYMGTSSGSASVLGLMNDTGNMVQLLIDRDVLREEYLGCHPCVNTSSIRFKTRYLTERFLPAVHHGYIEVDAPAE